MIAPLTSEAKGLLQMAPTECYGVSSEYRHSVHQPRRPRLGLRCCGNADGAQLVLANAFHDYCPPALMRPAR